MKISEFSKIIISGNIFNNTELEFFPNNKKAPRICNIYGKNGTGKSTISKGIKSNYENIIVKFKNIQNNELLREDADKIYLYNEEFIDANVKTSESGMKTIIMLGEQKDLDDQIDLLNDKRKILDKEQQRLNIEKEKFENQNDVCSPKHLKATIEHTLKSKWASRDKDIKGNIRNSTVQYDSMIKSITNNKDEEKTKEELQKEYKELLNIYTKTNNNATKINKSIDIIDKFTKNNVGLKKLLEKKIEIAEFTEREKLILSKIENGEQKFYETVRTEFSKNDIQFCPYCFQDITTIKDDIVKSISKILNKDVEEHKQELEELKAKYIVLEELDEDLNALDEKLVLEANNIIAKINEQINIYIIPKIDEKIDNIYNPIKEISTNIVELENSLNEIIKKLEDKRIKFNKSIDDKTENKKQLDNLNLKISWYEILDDYKSLEIQENLYKKLLLDIKTNKEELDKNYNEILKLQSDKQNVKIANDKINLFLEYIFLTKDKLKIEYDNNQDTYIVKSHNKDIKPKDLSTGERNIIALCYFFTKILENTNEKDEFRAPCLIILDDPISSFDMENKVGLYTFFRMMFDKIMKNNSESKIINFTHSLETMLNFGKACSDIKSDYILFELQNNQLYDFKYKSRNDYQKMLNEIYNYAMIDNYNIENELDDTIGNTMRKLLESYSTFNYNKGIEELTRNDKILDKLKKENQRQYYNNFMYRLILNNESHTYDNTRTINFYDYISREEKVKTAKSILLLLYLLDKTHLQLYFNNDSYLEIIKSWEEEIIPEMY